MVKAYPVLFIVGATGTGKSQLALELAREAACPILNADSVQIYQRVDLGTAKPSRSDRREVPHHLIDLVAPPNTFTAGQYRAKALEVLASIVPQSPVIVVGGSGFYVQALQRGMYDTSDVDSGVATQLRAQAADGGLPELYRELKARDPEFASRISENDSYRIVRAVALMRSHGKTPTQIREEFARKTAPAFPYPMLTIGLKIQREVLRERLRLRARAMVDSGLIDEVRQLVAEGFSQWSPLLSVGYKETQRYLQGLLSVEQLIEEITLNSMKLAKRQSTWFRRDAAIEWFDVESEWARAGERARAFLGTEPVLTGEPTAAKMGEKE